MSFLQAIQNYKYKNLTFFITVIVLVILILISVKPNSPTGHSSRTDNSQVTLDIEHLIAENTNSDDKGITEPAKLPDNPAIGDATAPATNNNQLVITNTEPAPVKENPVQNSSVEENNKLNFIEYRLKDKQTVVALFKSLGIANKEFYAIYNSPNGKLLDKVNARNSIYIAFIGNSKQVKALRYTDYQFVLDDSGNYQYMKLAQ